MRVYVSAQVVLISTDWVFDGAQGPADEHEPPNPINPYGFLKASSELVVTQRAHRGTVARIAGVQGVHLVWLALELELTGVLHCCGSSHTDRVSLARRAVEAFELEPELLRVGSVPPGATGSAPIPRDTRLDGRATAARLGVEPPDLDDMLERLGQDLQNTGEMRV